MSDLFKAFEKFLFRDISFLLGGSVLLGSVMCVFDKLPTGDVPAFEYFIWAGVSYAIGYSVQEFLTLLQLVQTKAGFSPSWLGCLLYRLSDRKRPEQIDAQDYEKAKHWLYQQPLQRYRDDHERIESLKQIGTTLGPCFFLAGSILFLKILFWKNTFNPEVFGYVVSLGLVVLGLILYLLGWLKVTQQAQYLIDRFNALMLL